MQGTAERPPTDLEAFRAAATAFLEQHAAPLDRSVSAWGVGSDEIAPYRVVAEHESEETIRTARRWLRTKYDAGFGWIAGPTRLGGQGLTLDHERAYLACESRYDVPTQTAFGSTIGMIAPTIEVHGPDWMRERLLVPMHRGDLLACQLLSEPEAGSDLAAVRTRAVADGDEWVLDGQKVWSSNAHHADVGLLLARTDPAAPKHRGLTVFLVPLRGPDATPGVEIRPLRQMTGAAEFNEVFLTGARVHDRFRIGAVHGGWPVIRTTLGNERAAIGAGGAGYGGAGLAGLVPPERVVQMLHHIGGADDPVLRQEAARLVTGYEIARYTALRTAGAIAAGQEPGPWTATAKLFLAGHLNRSASTVARILGPRITADTGEWGTFAWAQLLLGAAGVRIGGGTDEILRTTIAEKVLGLPR